jgi:uncharacterized membrane protein YoaK (UPF0700 family)
VTRLLVLLAVLVFVVGFAFLTLTVIVKQGGITILSLLSVLIVVLLAVGIVGALRNPPRR